MLASLTFIGLVWKCARLLGRDPRFAVVFVAAEPDLSDVRGRRVPQRLLHADSVDRGDRTRRCRATTARAGAAVMIAVAVKFTAILLLPFLLSG